MAISIVQSQTPPASGTGSYYVNDGAAATQTFASSTTTGNLIVCMLISWESPTGGANRVAFSDNKGNTYQLAAELVEDTNRVSIFYAQNITGGASHIVTCDPSGTGIYGCFSIFEVAGCATSGVLDKSVTTTFSTSSTTVAGPSTGTLAQADEILFGCVTSDAIPGTPAFAGAWTSYRRDDSGSDNHGGAGYLIVSSTASTTYTYNKDTNTDLTPAAIVSFKDGGGTTWNPSDKSSTLALSNGNLTATGATGGGTGRAIASLSSGKYYWELIIVTNASGISVGVGLANTSWTVDATYLGGNNDSICRYVDTASGVTWDIGGGGAGATQANISSGRICIAVDIDNKLIWTRNNNDGWYGSNTGDPAAGTNGQSFSALGSAPFYPAFNLDTSDVSTAAFLPSSWLYSPPSGFVGINAPPSAAIIKSLSTLFCG